jgi:hypothetical protein
MDNSKSTIGRAEGRGSSATSLSHIVSEKERVSPAKVQGANKRKGQCSLVRRIELWNPPSTYAIDQ